MADSKVPALSTPSGGLSLADIFYIVDVSDTTDDPTGSSRQDTLTNLQALMLVPSATDAIALGSATKQFADLFLAEGAVINWDNGDATLTQAGNMVTLAGADFTADNVIVNTALLPDANDGAALGAAGTAFSDLFLAEGAVINFDSGDFTITQTGNDLTFAGGTVQMPAAAAAEPGLQLQAGTLQTTPEVGSIEMDANAMYGTTDAGNRGVIPIRHIIRADATRTFASNTNQQAIFNSPANGALTLETGTYLFEALVSMDTMSATSGNGKFSLIGAGTATLGDILWLSNGLDAAVNTLGALSGVAEVIATQTATNIATAAVATVLTFWVRGTFAVTVAGTLIPSFAQTTAAAAVVKIGSFFYCERIGSTSLASVGQWS